MAAADKDSAITAAEEAYVSFRDLVLSTPWDRFAETVAGTWDLDSELAHLAGWYRELAPGFARVAAGQSAYAEDYADADAWNARIDAAKQHAEAALDDFDMAFHEFYAAAKACPEEYWGQDSAGARRPATDLFLGLTIEHQAEHRLAIEGWLAGGG